MPLRLRFAEHELPIQGDLEASGVTASQLHCAQDRRPAGQQLVGQAHGLVEIVSRDAELDRCFVLGVDHANRCYPVTLLRIPNSWRVALPRSSRMTAAGSTMPTSSDTGPRLAPIGSASISVEPIRQNHSSTSTARRAHPRRHTTSIPLHTVKPASANEN